jgi:hypothetical protein
MCVSSEDLSNSQSVYGTEKPTNTLVATSESLPQIWTSKDSDLRLRLAYGQVRTYRLAVNW